MFIIRKDASLYGLKQFTKESYLMKSDKVNDVCSHFWGYLINIITFYKANVLMV